MELQTIMFFSAVTTAAYAIGRYNWLRGRVKDIATTPVVSFSPKDIVQPTIKKEILLMAKFSKTFNELRDRSAKLKLTADQIEVDTKQAWCDVKQYYKLEIEPHIAISEDFKKLLIMERKQ